jgi:tRNA nucleotidyltransferase (CCA-adding enzyme)
MVGKSRPVSANLKIDPAELPGRLGAIPGSERLKSAAQGVNAYLVGGAVRDLLLGEPHPDLDVVVEGEVRPIAEALGGEVTEHERFETATVRLGELRVDLARARSETYARPGALPMVTPASIEEDLARRDFTINAMAVPLSGELELIDPHGGVADLGEGVIRVLHQASFRDDPTRALRAARYAARFGFELEPDTAGLLTDADLSTVSADRVNAELRRIAAEESPGKALALVRDWKLIPDLDPQGPERAARVADLVASSPWKGLVDRVDAVVLAVREPPEVCAKLAAATPERPSQAVGLARGQPPTQLIVARAMGAEWLDRYADEWRHVSLEIDGSDLIEAGIPEGPAVGRGLEAALSAKLDGELSGREEELRVAVAAARGEIPEG